MCVRTTVVRRTPRTGRTGRGIRKGTARRAAGRRGEEADFGDGTGTARAARRTGRGTGPCAAARRTA
ncbi:hypothetical protein AB0O07_20540 [Streptomyces sp. NPDC093085]|uniref:hypothetical protein n=1 Tax=Streptomyces sp. NPDC093085 TaxID=3155068 RepID=UPI0034444B4D